MSPKSSLISAFLCLASFTPFLQAATINTTRSIDLGHGVRIPTVPYESTVTYQRLILPRVNATLSSSSPFGDRVQLMEQWHRQEDPEGLASAFRVDIESNAKELPEEATLNPAPWPGGYYPAAFDGINYDWQRDGKNWNPVAKYAHAFNIPIEELEHYASIRFGVLKYHNSPAFKRCRRQTDCREGEYCGSRNGMPSGICIPTWHGLCHAWAPASIQEVEPRCPVQVNGVTFEVFDLKALVTAIYQVLLDRTGYTAQLGYRCDDQQLREGVDSFGRPKNVMCRDMNAGAFHLVLTNMIGRHGRAFIMDRDPKAAVWNHPIFAYRTVKNHEISAQQAAGIFERQQYPFNPNARKFRYVEMDVFYMNERNENAAFVPDRIFEASVSERVTYYYVLELDENDNVIGGEWLWHSINYHPDFVWAYTHRPHPNAIILPIRFKGKDGNETVDGIRYYWVKKLIEASHKCGKN